MHDEAALGKGPTVTHNPEKGTNAHWQARYILGVMHLVMCYASVVGLLNSLDVERAISPQLPRCTMAGFTTAKKYQTSVSSKWRNEGSGTGCIAKGTMVLQQGTMKGGDG